MTYRSEWPFDPTPSARPPGVVSLALSGIRVRGRHGANPGERDQPQEFVVDLDVVVRRAGDDLASTADYRDLVAEARRVVAERSFGLLETLAAEVAAAVARRPGVLAATATVHKPAAAGSLDAEDVAARAMAGPDEPDEPGESDEPG